MALLRPSDSGKPDSNSYKTFRFDEVFDQDSKQPEIYAEAAFSVVEESFKGYNGTIFAYGQTGTGKTHTMTGVENDPDHKGIMPRSFEDIFNNIKGDSN